MVVFFISPLLFRMLDITAGPPEPARSAAPDNIALNNAEEAPINTGSKSMPCFSKMRASLATNHGRQLMPIGEKGNGSFFNACAQSDAVGKTNVAIRMRKANLAAPPKNSQEDGKFREAFIRSPFSSVRCRSSTLRPEVSMWRYGRLTVHPGAIQS